MIRKTGTIVVPAMTMIFFSGCSLLMDDYKKVDSLDSDSADTETTGDSDTDSSENPPPVLTAEGDTDGLEGNTVEFIVTAQDPDDQHVVLSLEEGPEGAVFDPETGVFSWEVPFSAVDHAGRTADVVARFTGTDDGAPSATGTLEVSLLILSDADEDALGDGADNCPLVSNPEQVDYDSDGVGVVCDPWISLPAEMFDYRGGGDYSSTELVMTGNSAAVLVSSRPSDSTAFQYNSHRGLFIESDETLSGFPTVPMEETSDNLNMEMAGDGALWLKTTLSATSVTAWSRMADGLALALNRDGYRYTAHSDGSVLLENGTTLERWQGMMSETLLENMTSISLSQIGMTSYITAQADNGGTPEYGFYTLGPDGTFTEVTGDAENFQTFWTTGDYHMTCHRKGGVNTLNFWLEDAAAYSIDVTTDVLCSDLSVESVFKTIDAISPFEADGDHLWFVANHPDTSVSLLRCSISLEQCADLGALPVANAWSIEVHEAGDYRWVLNDTVLLNMHETGTSLYDVGIPVSYSYHYHASDDGSLSWAVWDDIGGYNIQIATISGTWLQPISSSNQVFPPPVVVSETGDFWWLLPVDSSNSAFYHCRLDYSGSPAEFRCEDTGLRSGPSIDSVSTDKNGNRLVQTSNGIFLASQGVLSHLRTLQNGYEVLLQPETAADDSTWWVTYRTNSGRWNLAYWRGAEFTDVATGQESNSRALRSGVDGTIGISLQDSLGWKLAVASGRTLDVVVSGVAEEPAFIGNTEVDHCLVRYTQEGELHILEVVDNTLTPRFVLDGTVTVYPTYMPSQTGALTLLLSSASGNRAWCPLTNDGISCQLADVPLDYPAGVAEDWARTSENLDGMVWTWPAGGDNSPGNFAVEAYLARSYPYRAPSACCAEGDDPGCGDFIVEMCVCAQDAACCDTAWSDACVALVEDAKCGLCY